jgi:hypothetical protein
MPERCVEGIKKEENKLTKSRINLYQRCLTRVLKKPWVVSGFRQLRTGNAPVNVDLKEFEGRRETA